MKLTKIITLLLAFIIFVLPVSALASAEVLPATYAGNTNSLIEIKNPNAATSSTANRACVISAVAVPGTTVTLYSYDAVNNQYVKMYSEGKALETEVGAAGLFAQNIELKNGSNTILVVASYGNYTETEKLEITLVKSEVAESIINIWQTLINY